MQGVGPVAVFFVAHHGAAGLFHMHTDLIFPSGFDLNIQQSEPLAAGNRPVTGDRLFPSLALGGGIDDMGFIFQQMYMMKNLTVLDNIILPACQSKKNQEKRSEIAKRGLELMHKLEIAYIANNDITEVSGGQLQRACICRSLMNRPKIIFADEPTGALNRVASEEVMEELTKINQEGTTILLVTHDVKVAAKCKKVLYLVDGNVKGEYNFEKEMQGDLRKREKELNNWLVDMGW